MCEQRDIAVQIFKHPLTGPNDLAIGADVALVGDPDAENLVLLVSGTHGVETLVGSGCQVAWLDRYTAEDLPKNTAVLLIHAMNPHGAAWRSRYTEDNIDLNRNFVDHSKPTQKTQTTPPYIRPLVAAARRVKKKPRPKKAILLPMRCGKVVASPSGLAPTRASPIPPASPNTSSNMASDEEVDLNNLNR